MKNTLEKKLNKTIHNNEELVSDLRKSESDMN